MSIKSCAIVGAGIAGLVAAERLRERGVRVVLLDKGRSVGGRLATRRMGNATLDHGAQYFTAKEERFKQYVEAWVQAGIVREWAKGFSTDGALPENGNARYIAPKGMTAITKHLANGLTIHTEARVVKLVHENHGWTLHTDNGEETSADAVLLTPPVPQVLELVRASMISLPIDVETNLSAVSYLPCIAALAVLSGASRVPSPGGVLVSGEPIAWIADNAQKGISSAPSVTIHATPAFSLDHWNDDDPTLTQTLLTAAAPYLGSNVQTVEIKKWRYALAKTFYSKPFELLTTTAPLALAGDGFLSPRVEGAALSGLYAADALLAL
jgi:renalase